MSTSLKIGFARQQYGRDRYDFQVDMTDLPLILAEHGIDPAAAGDLTWTRRVEILRLAAEVHVKTVYLKHEAADAGWERGKGMQPTAGMLGASKDLEARKAELDAILAPLPKAKVPEPAAT